MPPAHKPGKTSPPPRSDNREPLAVPALAVRELATTEKPDRKAFPGPRQAQARLRVAIDRRAQADLIAHAKSALDTEVCGVLAGRVCQDDEGLFLHVQATIRGTAAAQGSTQVTFTHETWNNIHQTLERDFPNLHIVGWYHSHPGFGVEFSEMDLFIQKNFFSGSTQIALVTDPLTGAVAIGINAPDGIEYLPRYWIDGREQEGKIPSVPPSDHPRGEPNSAREGTLKKLNELEARLGQLIQAVDEQRTWLYRFLVAAGLVFSLGVFCLTAYSINLQFKTRVEPPRQIGFASIPVQIGDHTALLGVQVVSWRLPPEIDLMQALAELKRQLEQQNAKQPGTHSGTNPAGAIKPQPQSGTTPLTPAPSP